MTTELSNFATRLRAHIAEANFETSNDLFPRLALELFRLQFAANSAYRRICEARGATPATISDWTAIPSVPTAAFKEFELSCLPAAERTHVFHSSGTTGQRPSRHFHNAESLATYEESLWPWFAANVLSAGDSTIGDRKLVLLTPSPAAAPNSSLVHMFDTVRRKLGASQGEYCAKIGAAGAWELDFELTTSRLRAFNSDNKPRLVLGTAFSFVHLLDHLAAAGLQFSLPAGSRVMETGGYKGRSREISKADLHQLITRHLGIPPSHIVCEYGMSELGSQAYDRDDKWRVPPDGIPRPSSPAPHHFHFPPWVRVQIISPETGRPVAPGESGLIRVFDLANVFSVLAIQTEDLGIGRGAGFELVGRAELAEPRGCSLLVG